MYVASIEEIWNVLNMNCQKSEWGKIVNLLMQNNLDFSLMIINLVYVLGL